MSSSSANSNNDFIGFSITVTNRFLFHPFDIVFKSIYFTLQEYHPLLRQNDLLLQAFILSLEFQLTNKAGTFENKRIKDQD